MEYRRRVQRKPTTWAGVCHIDGDSPSEWRDCEVIDFSVLGFGLTFQHPRPEELLNRKAVVDVSGISNTVKARLRGEIRNAARTLEGDVRVGIELVGLSRAEQAIATVLDEMSTSTS